MKGEGHIFTVAFNHMDEEMVLVCSCGWEEAWVHNPPLPEVNKASRRHLREERAANGSV